MNSDRENRDRSRDRDRTRRDRPTRFSESSRDRSPDRGKDRGGMKSSNNRIYVCNIPYEYRWQDLKDLFRNHVGDVAFVELFVDENDKAKGCGIVEFSDPNSVKKCLECMHRFELKGRKIVIREDFGNARDKYGNLIGGSGGGGGGSSKKRENRDENRDNRRWDERRNFDNSNNMQNNQMGPPAIPENKWGNTYGLSPAFLEELNINCSLSTRVFVANLEYKVDAKKLKEVFRMAGKVQYVDIPLGKDGQSRGFAVIEYDHPVESVQAISMFHNQPLFDRIMTVRMDRGGEREKLPDGLKTIGPGLGSNGEPLKDVARNLPNMGMSGQQDNVNPGPGILGAVPNLQLGVNAANALTNLNNVSSALGNLNSTSAVLQAANLAGVGGLSGNLLSGGLGNADLSLAANLVQNNPSLAALAASSNNMNNSSNNFNRPDGQSSFLSHQQNTGYNNSNNNPSNNRNYQSYDPKSNYSNNNFNNSNNDRESRNNSNSNNMYPGNNMGGNNMGGNSNMGGNNAPNNHMRQNEIKPQFSKKIIISNLPPTASYKMLSDKCREFGTVELVEEQGVGNIVVTFRNDWEADQAIKNMDRARIDGRTIDVRFY